MMILFMMIMREQLKAAKLFFREGRGINNLVTFKLIFHDGNKKTI